MPEPGARTRGKRGLRGLGEGGEELEEELVAGEVEGGVGGVHALDLVGEAEGDHVAGLVFRDVIFGDEALQGRSDEGGVGGFGLLGNSGEKALDEFVFHGMSSRELGI